MTNPLIKNNLNLVQQHLQNSIDTKKLVIEQCAPQIAEAGNAIVSCLKAGNKILACGNGGSAADAQHFAAELLGRFEKERIELPAIALTTDSSIITAIGNDYGYEVIFSKQVAGLGQAGDILLAISTSGNSANVIKAISKAQEKNLTIIALIGKDGGKIAQQLRPEDINICIPASRTSYIQESHLTIVHCLCSMVDVAYA